MGIFDAHRHADQAFAVAGHEVHVFCRAVLGGADEVPFIFTVRIVGDDDDMTGLQFFDSFFNVLNLRFSVVKIKTSL